ncbi:MAG: FHA domain-containing protein [Anaerolineae bacterium]|nr:FHA domain-containing protein [Anaerolineae bacterium]
MSNEVRNTTQWRLFLPDDSGTGQVLPIAEGAIFTIGRDADNSLPLDDSQISEHHARVRLRDDHLIIEDLGTTNGTVVNGETLKRPYVLQDGDVISLGNVRLVVQNIETVIEPAAAAPVAAAAPPQRRNELTPWLIAAIVVVALSVFGLFIVGVALLFSILFGQSSVAVTPTPPTPSGITTPIIIVNQAPEQNTAIEPDQTVTIQAIASDAAGITRAELWVNNAKVDEISNRLDQITPSMTASFQWSTPTPGSYTLQVRAYNEVGAVSIEPIAMITVVDTEPTATIAALTNPEPTPTPIPSTSTVTNTPAPIDTPVLGTVTPVPTVASLLLKVPVMVVRTGPSTLYDSIGRLEASDQPEIIGQADIGEGDWWQIRYDAAPDKVGWVSADPDLGIALNPFNVVQVTPPPLPTAIPSDTPIPTNTVPATDTPIPTATPLPPTSTVAATPTDTPPPPTVIRPPDGQTLLIVGNRSYANQSARLTLSGGKSVGGGLEIDPPPGDEVQVVLEPDSYRALWSAAYNSFTRGSDFTAVAGKVIVMWIVPEEGRTDTEIYDELLVNPTFTPTAMPTATTVPPSDNQHVAPAGKALLITGNRSQANEFSVFTLSGGTFGGGEQFILNANTETVLELGPGDYRAIWNSPANGGFDAGHEFSVAAGDVIYSWIVPEDGTVFMQFPGQPIIQVNN